MKIKLLLLASVLFMASCEKDDDPAQKSIPNNNRDISFRIKTQNSSYHFYKITNVDGKSVYTSLKSDSAQFIDDTLYIDTAKVRDFYRLIVKITPGGGNGIQIGRIWSNDTLRDFTPKFLSNNEQYLEYRIEY